MAYSRELVKMVKEVFPDCKQMHQLADQNHFWLGRWLCDSSDKAAISIDEIFAAKSLDELIEKANVLKKKRDVYLMWCKEDPRPKTYA